ncbi:MAG: sodium:calcium antiporter [Nostocaceae cyanobacterium]|nr:sodium:calcium antiporter [Nostocaceae cyanobacterium]
MLLFIQVILCIVLVIFVGSKLSQAADVLAEKTGLGRTWVGSILLAGATSLPELATGVGAVALLDPPAPDLAVGGIFGSCLFNLLILGLLDIFCGGDPLLKRAQISHGLAASFGCVMLGVAAGGMLMAENGTNLTLGWVGVPSIFLMMLYVVSAHTIAQFEIRRRNQVLQEEAEMYQYEHIKPQKAYVMFALFSLGIVVLGVWLAYLGEEVAVVTGLGESFVGALLLAAATSLPEVVASMTALKLDAIDLAVSNVFGSNLFNLAILGSYDLFYLRGNLLKNVGHIHVLTGIVAMVMTSVAIIGLIYNATRRTRLYITWDGITLIILYIVGMYAVYRNGS